MATVTEKYKKEAKQTIITRKTSQVLNVMLYIIEWYNTKKILISNVKIFNVFILIIACKEVFGNCV